MVDSCSNNQRGWLTLSIGIVGVILDNGMLKNCAIVNLITMVYDLLTFAVCVVLMLLTSPESPCIQITILYNFIVNIIKI